MVVRKLIIMMATTMTMIRMMTTMLMMMTTTKMLMQDYYTHPLYICTSGSQILSDGISSFSTPGYFALFQLKKSSCHDCKRKKKPDKLKFETKGKMSENHTVLPELLQKVPS